MFDPDVRFFADVAYLDPERAEKLDVYLPPKEMTGPYPAVLLIHGGGWRILDKRMEREKNIGYTLARAGYAVFSIDYLLNEVTRDPDTEAIVREVVAWPQNLYDCKTALRWIRKEAATYNVDGERIAAMGGSAGGHLAMLVAATARVDSLNQCGLYTDYANDVSCVLDFYGIADPHGKWAACFAGDTAEATAENLKAASVLTYLDEGFPPIFITHGSCDKLVPVEDSRELAAHLSRMNLPYWYYEIGSEGHSYHLQTGSMDLRPLVLQFLQEQLRGNTL